MTSGDVVGLIANMTSQFDDLKMQLVEKIEASLMKKSNEVAVEKDKDDESF